MIKFHYYFHILIKEEFRKINFVIFVTIQYCNYKNFKLENDPRVTKVGDFLRRTSIDELPQLINILNGTMSIVGPRPIVEKEVALYGKYAPKLFSVVPGLTGYWQANGRSDTTYEERIKMDMYYIDNRSLWLDLKIIFKTFGSVIRGEGAI